jgi:hypothetical protein
VARRTKIAEEVDLDRLRQGPAAQPADGKLSPNELRERVRALLAGWTIDRLGEHVVRAATSKSVTTEKFNEFMQGKQGSHHLHNALRTVLADLADYDPTAVRR